MMVMLNLCFSQGFNSITTPDGINVVAVGNAGKVYRSANGGNTFSGYIITSQHLNSVTSLGNDVWFAGQSGNTYKTQKTISPFNTYNVGSLVTLNGISFINSSTGFVCGDAGNVYKTVNGGINWSVSNSGIPSVKLNSISFRNSTNGTVVGSNGAIYVSSDGGASWSIQASGTTRNLLKVKYFNDSLAAVGEFGTLLLNKGSGWTPVITRTTSDLTGVSGTSMNDIHICGGGGFIRNNKNGNAKFSNFEMNPMLANLVDIFYYGNNIGLAVSSLNNAIINTNNGGQNWQIPSGATISYNWISKSPAGSGIGNNLCRHPTDRNSAYVVYGSTVYVSRDRGNNWTQIATIQGTGITGGNAHSFYVSPVDTNVWMAAVANVSPDKVVRSTNYGATWSVILAHNFSSFGQPLEMDQNNPNIYYFAPDGSSTGFFKSTNNGASFVSVSNSNPFTSPCDIIVMWDSSNVLYVGDDGADIFKSSNSGVNWTMVKPGSSAEIPSMCNSVFDKSICYATTWGSNQVFKTFNHGDNWSIVSANSGSGWGSDLCHEDPTVVLTGNYGSQAYLTTNGGSSFFNVNTGLGGAGAGIMVPDRGFFLNMQTSNLFKLDITYNYTPVTANIDVQALSIGASGFQLYQTATILPTGVVKNNNGVAAATFNVIRKISPGGYTSAKLVSNLAPNTSTNVSFDAWTFNAGSTYTVKDSVYIFDDTNTGNDVLSGSLTPNLGQTVIKLAEGFTVYPPSGWSFQFTGTNYWENGIVSSYGVGTNSSKYDFWNAPNGTNQSMLTPNFTASIAGDSLEYDYAYAPYSGSVDSLIIETSNNNGSSYSTLVRLYGQTGATGIYALNTAAGGNDFVPTSNQWLTKRWGLPVGTNKVKFRAVSAFGNNLYLDTIKIISSSLYTQYNVKLAPQGMYNGSTLNLRDTVSAYLRSTVSPFNRIDSATTVIDSLTLNAAFVFKNANSGTYYLHINHRNALETWSKAGGESITKGVTTNFDFTSLQTQAYGSNVVLVGSKWCLYSGDVVKDGLVDISDVIDIYNDATNFETGYIKTDLNGDLTVDVTDMLLAYNNSANFISKITPETSPADVVATKEALREGFRKHMNR